VCVCERERASECVCVCVCVCESESVCEREILHTGGISDPAAVARASWAWYTL